MRLPGLITLQMPSPSSFPTSHISYTMAFSVLWQRGSVLNVGRFKKLGSHYWCHGTDGTFGSLAECDDRDWLPCEMWVRDGTSSGEQQASWHLGSLASQRGNMAGGNRGCIFQPSISPLSSAQDFCTEAFMTRLFSLNFLWPRAPLSLIMTPSNL